MKTFLFTFLVCILSVQLSNAQWVQVSNGMDNRTVNALACSGNYLFAGTFYTNSGVYLSTDNGITWTQTSLNYSNVRALAVNGNNIFAGIDFGGVYKSTDNGTTWTLTSLNNLTVHSIAVNGNYIFAGTLYGVYLSTDNGTT